MDKKQINDQPINASFNQNATLTFNLEDFDAERRLKKMLDVDNYSIALYDISILLRKFIKYHEDSKVKFTTTYGENKEIVPDYDTMEYIESAFYEILRNNKIERDDLFE